MASAEVGETVGVSVLAGLPAMETDTNRKNSVRPSASVGISPWEDCIYVDELLFFVRGKEYPPIADPQAIVSPEPPGQYSPTLSFDL